MQGAWPKRAFPSWRSRFGKRLRLVTWSWCGLHRSCHVHPHLACLHQRQHRRRVLHRSYYTPPNAAARASSTAVCPAAYHGSNVRAFNNPPCCIPLRSYSPLIAEPRPRALCSSASNRYAEANGIPGRRQRRPACAGAAEECPRISAPRPKSPSAASEACMPTPAPWPHQARV